MTGQFRNAPTRLLRFQLPDIRLQQPLCSSVIFIGAPELFAGKAPTSNAEHFDIVDNFGEVDPAIEQVVDERCRSFELGDNLRERQSKKPIAEMSSSPLNWGSRERGAEENVT